MGTININVPGDIDLRFRIENMDVIKAIVQLVKNASAERKKKIKNVDSDIVGIWRDRFDEKLSAEMIQKDLRETTWKRF